MSGAELDHMITLRDGNVRATQTQLRAEIVQFIQGHEEAVLAQLRAHQSAIVNTSFGEIVLDLADLRAAVA